MEVRHTIFDSWSEGQIFQSLQSHWSPKFLLYPSLPLTNIIKIDLEQLTYREREYLYKTSIDYTFCHSDGRPILSIEFDGIGGGFSRNGVYIPTRQSVDPYRKLKMDLKLKVAEKAHYPFVITSYDEAQTLTENESLMILDGIIGYHLARLEYQKQIQRLVAEHWDEIEKLNEYERDDYVQTLGADAEAFADMEVNIIAIESAKYSYSCSQYGDYSYMVESFTDPTVPIAKGPYDLEGIRARAEGLKKVVRVGSKVTANAGNSTVTQSAWVRNFEGFGLYPPLIAQDIARYLAFKRLYFRLSGKWETDLE